MAASSSSDSIGVSRSLSAGKVSVDGVGGGGGGGGGATSPAAGGGGGVTTMNATLARKLAKVTEQGMDSVDLQTALRALGEFFPASNTLAARRQLRGDIERRSLEAHVEFLESVERVFALLRAIESDADAMAEQCRQLESRLARAQTGAGALLHRAEELRGERRRLQTRAELSQAFVHRFSPTAEELALLRQPSFDPAFFSALERLRLMHADSRLLLRGAHQQAGLELLESLGLQLQTAYDRLARFVQAQCRELLEPDTPATPPALASAFGALRDTHHLRPCLDEVESIRGRVVVRRFLDVVTRGSSATNLTSGTASSTSVSSSSSSSTSLASIPASPSPAGRPLELKAHDPLRYAGDMLAWIHQALANEWELLQSLFSAPTLSPTASALTDTSSSHQSFSSTTPTTAAVSLPAEVSMALSRALGREFDAVARPLSARLDAMAASRPPLGVVFRLAQLMDFYGRTTARLLPSDCTLLAVLSERKRSLMTQFLDQARELAEAMATAAPRPPADLGPPHAVAEQAGRVADVLATLDHGLAPTEERAVQATMVLDALVDPVLRLCAAAATAAAGLRAGEAAAFLVNCAAAFDGALAPYAFAAKRREALRAQIDAQLTTLVEEQTAQILRAGGLAPKLQLVHRHRPELGPLSAVPGMDGRALAQALRSFEAALFEAGTLAMPQCDRLQEASLRARARQSVAALIASAYAVLHRAIVDPINAYENPQSMIRYKPEQFALLCT